MKLRPLDTRIVEARNGRRASLPAATAACARPGPSPASRIGGHLPAFTDRQRIGRRLVDRAARRSEEKRDPEGDR